MHSPAGKCPDEESPARLHSSPLKPGSWPDLASAAQLGVGDGDAPD
ncbi:MAG: hypothetical protein Q7V05_14900 [Methanoregula sp.]|nr:hypothetical protein [Methanoregula sp.]